MNSQVPVQRNLEHKHELLGLCRYEPKLQKRNKKSLLLVKHGFELLVGGCQRLLPLTGLN